MPPVSLNTIIKPKVTQIQREHHLVKIIYIGLKSTDYFYKSLFHGIFSKPLTTAVIRICLDSEPAVCILGIHLHIVISCQYFLLFNFMIIFEPLHSNSLDDFFLLFLIVVVCEDACKGRRNLDCWASGNLHINPCENAFIHVEFCEKRVVWYHKRTVE